jgi:hypothetical protein
MLLALPVSAQEQDATRLEVGERYCFDDAACLAAVQRDVRLNRPIQWVIYTVLQTFYADDPANAEYAYDASIRALTYAMDFLSEPEWRAGQTDYAGENAATLKQIFRRYAVACENKINWLPKYHCIRRALYPLLPGEYEPTLVPIYPPPES